MTALRTILPAALLLSLTLGCSDKGAKGDGPPTGPIPPERQPISTDQMLKAFAATGVEDAAGWVADTQAAFDELGLTASIESTCSVAALVEHESGFEPNRSLTDVSAMVEGWILSTLHRYEPRGTGPFEKALDEVFNTAGHGHTQSFRQRLNQAKDEATVYRIYHELVETFEYSWPRAFETVNFAGGVDDIDALDFDPMTTAGCMGVPMGFVLSQAGGKRSKIDEAMTQVYTRPGCLKAGVAKLFAGGDSYDDPIYRFAEFHGKRFASRNAAFQERVHTLTGRPIPLDGRLLFYEGDGSISLRPSPTFLGLLALRDRYGIPLSESKMMRDLAKEKTLELEATATWDRVERTYLSNSGLQPTYARIPELSFIDRRGEARTAAWFSNQVMQGYKTCLLRMN